jgi:hypothetical protein
MTKANGDLWVTRTEAARLCGYCARHFDSAIRPRVRDEDKRGSGTRFMTYRAAAVVQAFGQYAREQQQQRY